MTKRKQAGPGPLLRTAARMYVRAQRVVIGSSRRTATQCYLLSELSRSPPLSITRLGARLGLEKSWASRAVDTLVAEGLLVKSPNPEDARGQLVALTQAGQDAVSDMNRALDEHSEQLLSSLTEDERTNVEKVLRQLIDALSRDPSTVGGGPSAGSWSAQGWKTHKP